MLKDENPKPIELKKEIKRALKGLYLLKSTETAELLENLDYLPEEALLAVLEVLKAGHVKQDEFLQKLNERDGKFNVGLKKFLNKASKDVTDQVTERERAGADALLNDL
jgi:hypothetical protein